MSLLRLIGTALLTLMTFSCTAVDSPYVAFSLREAQRRAQSGEKGNRELRSLGGMTRIVGMVHDRESQDIILVGRKVVNQPEASLDDIVVALRCRLRLNQWPMVSIDPTPETPKTGQQIVSFRGGLEGTIFGRDFLESDILLKKYSLEQVPSIDSVPSYESLCFDRIKKQIEDDGAAAVQFQRLPRDSITELYGRGVRSSESYYARFWFYPLEPCRTVAREDVFCIKELRLGVSEELEYVDAGGTQTGESHASFQPARQFSSAFTEHFQEITSTYPLLKRLKVLFDLIAVAEGIRDMESRPSLDYFLNNYTISHAKTPLSYELVTNCALISRSDGRQHVVQLSGGIEFRTELKWLNYGDVTPLRNIVLKSRPTPQSLTWSLPLEDWRMPNSDDLPLRQVDSDGGHGKPTQAEGNRTRCAVSLNSVALESPKAVVHEPATKFNGFPPVVSVPPLPFGGVSMKMEVDTRSFRPDSTGALDSLRRSILRERPDQKAVDWPASKKGNSK